MKKINIKYFLLIVIFFISIISYLSLIGIETKKFNNQIRTKITQTNNNLEVKLRKIKLTLDPLNFKINAKTVGTNILYKGKNLELEYIKTQISLVSLIKNKFVFSNLSLSTKSILLKDLVTFLKVTIGGPKLFILEKAIKKGHVIADVVLNFDENGKIEPNYIINATLEDGAVNFFKEYEFKKINFLVNVENNVLNFNNVSFTTEKTNLFSNNLKITKIKKKDLLFEGEIHNKKSILNDRFLKLINLDFNKLKLVNTSFTSKNKFSFIFNDKFKIKDLAIVSEIHINESGYQKSSSLNDYFPKANDTILIKDHHIQTKYQKDNFTIEGNGKIKLENNFDEIKYKIGIKEKDFTLISNIKLSELRLKKQEFLKPFFPKLKEMIDLKNQQIEINYNRNDLFIKGTGKIKLEKEFDDIDFNISKIKDNFNFDSQINLDKTSFNIDFLNFKKNEKLKTKLKFVGSYNKKKQLNFSKISITGKKNKILLKNILLDNENKFIRIEKADLDYFDVENKKNQLLLLRKQNDDYEIYGSLFNANRLINILLKSKTDEDSKFFKNNINLNLDLKEVYISDQDIVSNLKGKLTIINNEVFKANIAGLIDKNENLTFSVYTNNDDEKITTFFSSRAKPIVKRYKFIKGYEEGYLDFYSIKKNNISKSKLKIYDFKLKELPALTKLLTLASLQGIADILSGEGIRFDEFEMNFKNDDNLMTIDEIYAIGPAISILMSGYIDENELISLRGTLVPATTINKSISAIPLLGKILVGDKTGEGVFGVSFKIKGYPKKLETTVNPIKTLTPRFITRTLEKIKKN
jgi:hypothetical protein